MTNYETVLAILFISWLIGFIACSISFWKDVLKVGRLKVEDLAQWLLFSIIPLLNLLGVWVLITESFTAFGRWAAHLGRKELWRRK